jgi:hypothetical protein
VRVLLFGRYFPLSRLNCGLTDQAESHPGRRAKDLLFFSGCSFPRGFVAISEPVFGGVYPERDEGPQNDILIRLRDRMK